MTLLHERVKSTFPTAKDTPLLVFELRLQELKGGGIRGKTTVVAARGRRDRGPSGSTDDGCWCYFGHGVSVVLVVDADEIMR